ncbi:MAG: site-2 protease family protein [Trueperaceae bacterium]
MVLGGIIPRYLSEPAVMMICAIIMIIALILHNIVQAYVASRSGDNSAKFSGFMRFDPQQHLEPFGVLMLFILGFGWSRMIPTNSRNYPGRGQSEVWVWYSGPLTFFVLAFLCYLFMTIFIRLNQPQLVSAFAASGGYLVLHAAIHLFPVFPLDGAKAAMIWGNRDVRRIIQQLASFPYSFLLIFLVLSFLGVTGFVIGLLQSLILTIIGFIPGLGI